MSKARPPFILRKSNPISIICCNGPPKDANPIFSNPLPLTTEFIIISVNILFIPDPPCISSLKVSSFSTCCCSSSGSSSSCSSGSVFFSSIGCLWYVSVDDFSVFTVCVILFGRDCARNEKCSLSNGIIGEG